MDFDREQRTAGTPLKVDQILDLLDDDKATLLRDALMSTDYSNEVIARTVTNQTDHSLSDSAVRNWRARYRQ